MSIALSNRIKELERQVALLRAQLDEVIPKVTTLTTPRPPGRPKKKHG